ncbi:Rha family transcriptional regulator [Dysgonomonas sp.]
MRDLVFKSDKGNPITNSLLVAEKFGKQHLHVLRDIDNLKKDVSNFGLMFIESVYPDSYSREQRMYIMNRDGFTLLAMGFTGEKALKFKVAFIDAFNRMEEALKSQYSIPQTYAGALRLAADKIEEAERLKIESREKDRIIEEQAPAVIFKQSVEGSKTNISVEHMAKILCQNGINIGQNRLFDWFVKNKYLIRHKRWSNKRQVFINDYTQTQKAAEQMLFFITSTVINPAIAESFVKHTVKVTGKGQTYFINKFLTK